ncbi:MAG: hypothetical protein ACOYL3_06265 [Desulfuromonadaceae bacterium]
MKLDELAHEISSDELRTSAEKAAELIVHQFRISAR